MWRDAAPAKVGVPLKDGASLQIAEGSRTFVRFARGAGALLEERSEAVLSRAARGQRIALVRGMVTAVRPPRSSEMMEVRVRQYEPEGLCQDPLPEEPRHGG